jgi:purine-binding chemotaxis protein CheW
MFSSRPGDGTGDSLVAIARHSERSHGLIVAVGSRACAIPLAHVVETMRPLRLEPIAGMPSFVLGLSVIRGAPTPVVDLAAVLGGSHAIAPTRFVVLRLGERVVALAVDRVIGVRELDAMRLQEMPPLLRSASADVIEAIGMLDAQLLVALRATRILADETWNVLEAHEGGP